MSSSWTDRNRERQREGDRKGKKQQQNHISRITALLKNTTEKLKKVSASSYPVSRVLTGPSLKKPP